MTRTNRQIVLVTKRISTKDMHFFKTGSFLPASYMPSCTWNESRKEQIHERPWCVGDWVVVEYVQNDTFKENVKD